MHPGGANLLYAPAVAGRDATQAFFGLHRHEVLLKPQYARLQIGSIAGETEQIRAPAPGETSGVPYAEPTWLCEGYYSPYYTEGHRAFQKAVRTLFMEVVAPESARCEADGSRISEEVTRKLRCVLVGGLELIGVLMGCAQRREFPPHAPRPGQAPERPHAAERRQARGV